MYKQDVNSTYDIKAHTRYPTIDFIKNETGEDMTVLVGSELRAKATIKQIVNDFKSYLSKNKLRETYNAIEYLVATNEEWINEWNRIIAAIIFTEYNDPQDRELIIKNLIEGSSLFKIERFMYSKYNYRVGY